MTIQVGWNQPREFQNIVVHPARMYIIAIFACIGTLMKCPALEFYVIAVYGEKRGIYNGKSWMKAMRLFQSVAAALLQRFLSIRQKTVDGIEKYSKHLIYIQLLHTRFWLLAICKGVPKGILRSADLINECISHVQFLIDGKVSTQD